MVLCSILLNNLCFDFFSGLQYDCIFHSYALNMDALLKVSGKLSMKQEKRWVWSSRMLVKLLWWCHADKCFSVRFSNSCITIKRGDFSFFSLHVVAQGLGDWINCVGELTMGKRLHICLFSLLVQHYVSHSFTLRVKFQRTLSRFPSRYVCQTDEQCSFLSRSPRLP